MTRLVAAALLCIAVAFAGSAYAQTRMRPGLWEHNFVMKSESGQLERAMSDMHKQLASMPPEQRRKFEQMMAQQGVGMGANGRSVRMCITKEQAERDEIPQQDGSCRQQVVQRTANMLKVKFTCTGNPPASGESEVTFTSATAYAGKSVVDTTVDGKPERMTMEQTGKWISSDCGSIKPLAR